MFNRVVVFCCLVFGPVPQALALPDGPGRSDVERHCSACHSPAYIERSSGYTRLDWQTLIGTMVDLSAAPDVQERVVSYLGRNFRPNDRRSPELLPGPVEVEFESWQVPTLGQRSRDPVAAPDGSIWWAGQWGNLVGRLDPGTGAMQEYALPAGTYPHSVTPDAKGNIWILGNRNGSVQVLDPATGDRRIYQMPSPDAKDPHTGVFDQQGRFWFTLQHSNMVGRIDPATDDIRLITLERPSSRPYGIKIAADGSAWVACNGGPCMVHLAAEDMAQTRIDLPNQESHVRRLDIAGDGSIWYGNSGAGRLGQYNPDTGVIREWPSPSGPDSHPYGLVVVQGVVWYNESGKRPDALVRFDPATETFQSWPIPSSGVHTGILRHVRADAQGRLLIHQSASNHILRVSVGRP